MTSASIAKASASKNQTGSWVVDYTMTKRGSALWDEVAEENFHKILSIDFDGRVVSAPIIQPTQSSFSSFGGRGEISGNLTKAEALALAMALSRT
jgi:preprotein translocase subunit SecD